MMKIDSAKFGLAAASAVALIWIFCSLLVALLPGMSMSMSGYMMHADLSGMSWQMGFAGFLFGLILWSISAGVFASLMGTIYNKLL